MVTANKITEGRKDYNSIISSIGLEFINDFNNMIIFDYLVNNTDRHHKNFGLLVDEKNVSVKFATLYDHGFSLCSDFDNEYLKSENIDDILMDCGYSKLCCGCNYDQFKLVKSYTCNLNFLYDDLESIVNKYSNYLELYRVNVIKNLLKFRLKKIKEELPWKDTT